MITTVRRADIFDALCEAVDAARDAVAHDPKRVERINTAWGWLLEQDVYELVHANTPLCALVIPSQSTPGVRYHVGWRCDCPAPRECWHLDASDLLGRAHRIAAGLMTARPAPVYRSEPRRAAQPAAPVFAGRRCDDAAISAETLVDELFA